MKSILTQMPPSRIFSDFETVAFESQVVAAYYGVPSTSSSISSSSDAANNQLFDVTDQIMALQKQGRNMIEGGVHTVLQAVPALKNVGRNILSVWYDTEPTQTFADFADVALAGKVVAASYGAPGHVRHNVLEKIQRLQSEGRNTICGGIHTAIGDPDPSKAKVFCVWYA